MIIKSPFKDYYDCMQGTDQDKQTRFIRQPFEEKKGWKWPFPDANTIYRRYSSVPYLCSNTHIVGFCGKIYGCVELTWNDWNQAAQAGWDADKTFCYNLDEINHWMKRHLDEAQMAVYEGRERHLRRYRKSIARHHHDHPPAGSRRFYEKFFEEVEKQKTAHEGLFLKNNVPIFIASSRDSADGDSITYNGMIKNVEFYRIFSPALAYQELTTYIYNTAVPMKPIPVFDDITMAESKGFDKKTSFRKDPIRKRKK